MQTVIDKLSDIFSAGFSAAGYDAALGRVVVSARPDLCQFQCNGAMSAAKQYRKAPLAIADDVAAALPANDVVATVSVVAPGFINITVKDEFIACYLEEMNQSENCGFAKVENPRTVVIDYGGPNVAKPLHVGHLRSAVIGECLKRLNRFAGNKVIADAHLGDWGLQMGLIIHELSLRHPELPYFDENYAGDYPQEAPFTLADLEQIYPFASAKSKEDEAYLAAARTAGVHRIFKVGGAQAVGALAYGTESVPRVDKIVGPGNAYVAEAKKQVFGQVAIDMIAGPSEVLVVADAASDPAYVAADLLSQAEHDKMASAVLVTDSMELARAVSAEVERQLPLLEREEIARASIEDNGKILVTRDLWEGIEVADRIAPEHLELCVDRPFDYLGAVHNAGSVFLGRYDPEPLGDYFAGPNHTLPTSGTARFYSPLSVDDFVKKSQFSYYTREALEKEYRKVSCFARKEGLTAHARAVEIRFEGREGQA